MEREGQERLLLRLRGGAVACILLAAFLEGLARSTPNRSGVTGGVAVMVIGMSAAFWCAVDGNLRGRTEFWTAQWQLYTVWPLAIPAYLIETRRRRSIRILLLSPIVLVVASVAGRLLGDLLAGA